ncbi:Gp44 (endogenous virus) [Propionibacterium phage PAS50]|uniref:Gp44 n=2 Tax=Pahexavirus TaxID=1982251 RepID=F4MII8_9CAUD|nr:Gp44 [Propionibacterium phage PAS50]YP_004414793.1 Gp44 [Propionibacterium phage PAD20]ACX30837.1 Gp44 [Propionibacterium phage PAD20]ACX30883.1 Gp44 [Propionibacterium phage PAS50]
MAHSSHHPSHPSTGRQKSTRLASTASPETIQTTSISIWCAACTTLKYKKPYDSSGHCGLSPSTAQYMGHPTGATSPRMRPRNSTISST